jgi:hypothetical protein
MNKNRLSTGCGRFVHSLFVWIEKPCYSSDKAIISLREIHALSLFYFWRILKMDYKIKHVTTEQELDNALEFSRIIFGEHHTGLGSREKQKEEMLINMERNNDLLLYTELNGEVVLL